MLVEFLQAGDPSLALRSIDLGRRGGRGTCSSRKKQCKVSAYAHSKVLACIAKASYISMLMQQ